MIKVIISDKQLRYSLPKKQRSGINDLSFTQLNLKINDVFNNAKRTNSCKSN